MSKRKKQRSRTAGTPQWLVSGVIFHARRNEELCTDGTEHDWQGWRDFEDGRGGETVCARCGMGAMSHSLRYGI